MGNVRRQAEGSEYDSQTALQNYSSLLTLLNDNKEGSLSLTSRAKDLTMKEFLSLSQWPMGFSLLSPGHFLLHGKICEL